MPFNEGWLGQEGGNDAFGGKRAGDNGM